FDTAVWTIDKINKPDIEFHTPDIDLCEGECAEVRFSHNSTIPREITISTFATAPNFTERFTIVPGEDLVFTVCTDPFSPPSFYNIHQTFIRPYFITLFKEEFCDFAPEVGDNAAIITVKESPKITINETLCPGGSITIGNMTFDENNPSGTVLVPGAGNDCDSLFTVELSFAPEARGSFLQQTCDQNFTLTLGSQTFDKNNTSGTVILQEASFFGCDSIVDVTLTFLPSVQNQIDKTTCDPDFTLT